MKRNKNISMPQTSDSSISIDEVTSAEKNVVSILNGARAIAGPSSQVPKPADSAENRIRTNFRKSIIKRAVHPSIISSTPFHSVKTRNSFENISTISDIGNENDSLRNKTLSIVEENDCEKIDQQEQKNTSKELIVLLDHTNDCVNESVGNKSKNTSMKEDSRKNISLRSAKNQNMSACSERDQCNQSRSIKKNKDNSKILKQQNLDEILGLSVSKGHADRSENTEKTVVHDKSNEVGKNYSPAKRGDNLINEDKDDNITPERNVRGESKIITERSSTDLEELISKSRQKEESNNKDHNHTRVSNTSMKPVGEIAESSDVEVCSDKEEPILKTRPLQQKQTDNENRNHSRNANLTLKDQSKTGQTNEDVESSEMEIHSRSRRKVSKSRQNQEKRKNDDEYYGNSPLKRNRTFENKVRSRSRSRPKAVKYVHTEDSKDYSDSNEEFEVTKSKFSRKKGYSSSEENRSLIDGDKMRAKRILEEREKSIKRKKYFSDEQENELNKKHTVRSKKALSKPEESKNFRCRQYSSIEVDAEEPKMRGNKSVQKTETSRFSKRRDDFSDEDIEFDEEYKVRGKKEVQKREKYYERNDYSGSEIDIDSSENHKIRRKNQEKSAMSKTFKRKIDSSSEEESELYEVHKIQGKKVIQKPGSSRNFTRKTYSDFEENWDQKYEKRGKRVPLERVRAKSYNRRIYESPEYGRELNEAGKTKSRKAVQKVERHKSLKRKVYESPDESTEIKVHRKTLQKPGRSKSLMRKIYHSPENNSDLNDEHKAIGKKIVLKRQRSKSLKRRDYHSPKKSSSDSDELSEDSDSYEEVRKGKAIKKVLYVLEDDSTVSDARTEKLKKKRHRSMSEKKYKYVESSEQKLRKRLKDQNIETDRHPNKMKTKRRITEVVVDESDIEEDQVRIRQSKRYPSHHEPKQFEKVRPSSSKRYTIMKNLNESLSPQRNQPVLSKKYGRLSRRDSYILEQRTKGSRARSVREKNDESSVQVQDSNDENYVTPVNRKITLKQPGMTTIIRGIVDQQLAKFNEAKGRPVADLTIKEANKTLDKTSKNEGIIDIPNEIEDDEVEIISKDTSNNEEDYLQEENAPKNIIANIFENLLLNNESDDISNESRGQQTGLLSESSNGLSVSNLQESIQTVDIIKQGNIAQFNSNASQPLQRLARRPNKTLDPTLNSCIKTKGQPSKKTKKGLIDVIESLKTDINQRNRSIVNVSVQTSLIEQKTAAVLPSGNNTEISAKDVICDAHNVASSSVKTSKIPVKSQKRILRTTSNTREEGTVEKETADLAHQEKNIQTPTDPNVSIARSIDISTNSKRRSLRTKSNTKGEEPTERHPIILVSQEENEQVTINKHPTKEDNQTKEFPDFVPDKENNPPTLIQLEKNKDSRPKIVLEQENLVPIDPDVTILTPKKLLVNSKKEKQRLKSNTKDTSSTTIELTEMVSQGESVQVLVNQVDADDDGSTEVVPEKDNQTHLDQDTSIVKSRRKKRRSKSNTKEDEEPIHLDVKENYPFAKPEEVTKSRRRSKRSTLNTKEDSRTEIESIDLEPQEKLKDVPFVEPEVTKNSRTSTRRSRLKFHGDERSDIEPTTSESQEETVEDVPLVKPEVTKKNRTSTRTSRLNARGEERAEIEPTDLKSQEEKLDDVPFVEPEVTKKSRTSTRRSRLNARGDERAEFEPTDSESQEEKLEHDPIVKPEVTKKSRTSTRRSRLNAGGEERAEIEPTDSEAQEEKLEEDVPFVKPDVTGKSRTSTGRSRLIARGDERVEIEPTHSESQEQTVEDLTFVKPAVTKKRSSSTRSSRLNAKQDEQYEIEPTDSESQAEVVNENVSFVKPKGAPLKSKKKMQKAASSTEDENTFENEASTSDSKSSKPDKNLIIHDNVLIQAKSETSRGRSKKQNSRTTEKEVKEKTGEEVLSLRRSAREKRTVDLHWWTDILGIPSKNKSTSRDTSTDTHSPSPKKKKRPRQRLTRKENKSPTKQNKGKTSKQTDEENEGRSDTNNEINNELDTDKETEIPSTSITKKKKRRQRLTMKVNKSRSQNKEKNSRLIDEGNEIEKEISNALETNNATEINERLTEIYNSTEGNSRRGDSVGCSEIDRPTTSSCPNEWRIIDKMKKSLGQHTNELYELGETFGFLALARGQKRYSVNNQYEVVYLKLEGTIKLIIEDTLYPEVPDTFFIQKGVRVQFENIGIGRALFFFILR